MTMVRGVRRGTPDTVAVVARRSLPVARPDSRLVVGAAGLAVGVTLVWLPLRGVRLDAMNGYGLVSVLPIATLLGLAVLTIGYMVTLGARRPHRALLAVQLVVTVVSLHALAQALEPLARFPTAWQHAGLIEYITRTHGVDTQLDARLNWPGFFATAGFATEVAGRHDLEPVLRWAPIVTNLLFLAPLALILRTLRASWRARWFAAWLFPVANWVGQDYLSPQAFGYLLYLCWVAILVNWFRPDPAPRAAAHARRRSGHRAGRPLTPGEVRPRPIGGPDRSLLFLLLVGVLLIATAAHQLTPFMMIATTAGLVAVRRCALPGLPLLGVVVFCAWVSFMTSAYWVGHLDEVFGGLGRLGTNLSTSVEERITTGSHELATVQSTRIGLAVALSVLAFLGLMRRRLMRLDDRVAPVLLLAPFTSFGLQNYGGEIALRTYLFMLPGACVLVAFLFFPGPPPPADPGPRPPGIRARLRGHATVLTAAGAALALVAGFVFVRFGNESFERVGPGSVRAFDVMLQTRPTGPVSVFWLTAEDTTASGFPVMPWSYRSFERLDYPVISTSRDPARDAELVAARLRTQDPTGFFLTTRGQEAYLELSGGLPHGYGVRLREALSRNGDLQAVFTDRDAAAFALRGAPVRPDVPAPAAASWGIGMTPWTPAGIVYLPVLLGLLVARELRRLRLRPGERRRLWTYTAPAVPLLAGCVAIVVERFLTLG